MVSATKDSLVKLLKNVKATKDPKIYQMLWTFLKDEAKILPKPNSKLCDFSMTLGSFPKVKPLFENDPSNYRPTSQLPLLFEVFEKELFYIK